MPAYQRRVPSRFPLAASTAVRAGKRRRVTTAAKADAALRLARSLARQVETKAFATVIGNTDMIVGTSTNVLNAIAQGDGDGQRTGLAINAKRLDLKLRLASFVQSNLTWRVLVVQDKQSNNVAPNYSDVVNGNTTLGAYNPVNMDRFSVLYDSVITQQATFVGGDMTVPLSISLKKGFAGGGEMRFNAAGGGTWDKNPLFLMVTCDYAAVGNVVTQGLAAGDAQYQMLGTLYFSDA